MLIAGIDEAGRGCIIGPLVIAGVLIKEENLPLLTQLGVKDSKLLSPKKRQTLATINTLKPDKAYVDAADVIEDRFKYHIQEGLTIKTKITSKHKADKIYPVVSAASIIAKVERDKEIATLKDKYGDFGSGYLTDQKTIHFLKQWLQTHAEYADCVRKSWKPAKQAKNEKGTVQKQLA
jgi:ribonuclease HII